MKVREATIEIYWKTYTLAAFHERGSGRLLSSLKCICEPSCHKKIHQGEHIQDRYQNLQKILTPGEEFVSWYESWRGTVGDDPHAQRQMSICGKMIWKRLSQIQEQSYERMSLRFFCFIPVPRHSYFLKTRVKLLHKMLLLVSVEQKPSSFRLFAKVLDRFPLTLFLQYLPT